MMMEPAPEKASAWVYVCVCARLCVRVPWAQKGTAECTRVLVSVHLTCRVHVLSRDISGAKEPLAEKLAT